MEPFLGQIQAFGFNFAPRGWAHCNGQLLSIAQNSALYALLGTFYGGDGRSTFALPDLRGRAPIHYGRGIGLTNYDIASRGGLEAVTLRTSQMPPHTHGMMVSSQDADRASGRGMAFGSTGEDLPLFTSNSPDVELGPRVISQSGGGQAHENRPPYLAINWCIALVGTFPSRS